MTLRCQKSLYFHIETWLQIYKRCQTQLNLWQLYQIHLLEWHQNPLLDCNQDHLKEIQQKNFHFLSSIILFWNLKHLHQNQSKMLLQPQSTNRQKVTISQTFLITARKKEQLLVKEKNCTMTLKNLLLLIIFSGELLDQSLGLKFHRIMKMLLSNSRLQTKSLKTPKHLLLLFLNSISWQE